MKQIFTLIIFLSFGLSIEAQVAPDFTVIDIEGTEHNLYSYLDAGKVVVLDVSATWCPKCWDFHTGKFLEDITTKYGPDGTDQVQVLFYEGDKNTTLAQLEGGAGSVGNWIEGTNYPIINENPLSIDMSVYNNGFPTVSVIRPVDKEIVGELYAVFKNGGGLEGMEVIIEEAFSIVDVKQFDELSVSVYPNPMEDQVHIDLTQIDNQIDRIEIVNLLGQVVLSKKTTGKTNLRIDVTDFDAGLYLMNLKNGHEILGTKKLIKE